MLKVLKRVLLIIGLVAIVGLALYFFFVVWQDVRNLWAVAVSNQSATQLSNPRWKILVTTGLTLVAGVILGLGIAFPSKRRYDEAELDKRVAKQLEETTQGTVPLR